MQKVLTFNVTASKKIDGNNNELVDLEQLNAELENGFVVKDLHKIASNTNPIITLVFVLEKKD